MFGQSFEAFLYQSISFGFCICKHYEVYNWSNVYQIITPIFSLQKWNKKITFPLLFSIICCLTQYHQQGHLVTLFFCIWDSHYSCWILRTCFTQYYHLTLRKLFWKNLVFLFYLTIQPSLCFIWQSTLHLKPEIRSFFLSFLLQACKLSKADSKAKTSSIHPTSHCAGARNKSVENFVPLKKKKNLKIFVLLSHPCLSPTPIWH